ncbi:MAG TPA: oligosaccharide flippase family protein [Terriglobales bacterium]|nr:oligosaccharide flippase family protein [Terriglobales bacterium]
MTTPPIASAQASDFKSHVKNISQQSSVFLFGTLFSAAAAYFFKIYLARVLGAEALGIYALGMTVVGLAGVLAAGGLPQAANRFVAVYSATGQAQKLGRFLWSSLAFLIISNVLAGVLILAVRRWIAGPVYHTPALASYLHFFIPIMLTGSLTAFLGLALAGFKDVTRRTIITNFVGQTLTMAFSIALLVAGFGLTGYLVAQIGSALVVLLLLGWSTWKLCPQPARWPSFGLPLLEPEVVSFSVTFFGVQALTFLLSQSDKVLLGIYINPREVGIYSIAATLVAFVPLALQSVNQIFSPTIAELHAQGNLELLARLFRSLIKWTLGLTIPLAAVMILFARHIMGMFGSEFAPGWPVLIAGTFGQLVNCGVGSVGFLLLMSGHERRVLKIQTVMAVLVVCLNLALIPLMGLLGAAIAGAIVNAGTNLWSLAEVRGSLGIAPSVRKYVALVPPTVAMFAAVLLLQHFMPTTWPGWAVILAALTTGYLAFAAASFLSLDADDRVIARMIRSRVRGLTSAKLGDPFS